MTCGEYSALHVLVLWLLNMSDRQSTSTTQDAPDLASHLVMLVQINVRRSRGRNGLIVR